MRKGTITHKTVFTEGPDGRIVQLSIHAPDIARQGRPGQFVVVMANSRGERVPLTIVERQVGTGSFTCVLQEAGYSTRILGHMKPGDRVYAVVGPLGHPTDTSFRGRVACVGGGVGIAELFPVVRGLAESGNQVTAVLGARSAQFLILEDQIRAQARDVVITTDDGSAGIQGTVAVALRDLLRREQFDYAYTVGPLPMMRAVAELTREWEVPTMASFNTLMVDATGMCGSCRMTVGGEVKFACVDGPEFDAHAVDWQELRQRAHVYDSQQTHICKLPFADERTDTSE
ncbi:MAG: sulfide/dihydroorotate dehydrogenase-like FAD/NAD-binding protein [Candidatus Omnitrophica bacterium]|nr:sulfide/dihydroorotate dehydrogenase-like FAD/NAD-binding protein [Candidatus Omnitrophota bacterium]